MGFTGNELLKTADFLHVNSITGFFILFLFLSALLAFFVLAFSYAFIDIIWKSIVVFVLFLPAVFYFDLSEDINKVINEFREKIYR